MILDIMDNIEKLFNDFKDYVNDHADNPFFWIIIFLVLLVSTAYFISNYANK